MSTTSRRLSNKARGNKSNHTPGKEKGATCQKSDLKRWGASANPYKLNGRAAHRFLEYTDHVKQLNR